MVVIDLSRTVSEMNGDFRRKSPIFPTSVCLTPSPLNRISAQGSLETRMMVIPDGWKSFKIGLAILIQYQHVTDSQPASHVAIASTRYAYLHRAVIKQIFCWNWNDLVLFCCNILWTRKNSIFLAHKMSQQNTDSVTGTSSSSYRAIQVPVWSRSFARNFSHFKCTRVLDPERK